MTCSGDNGDCPEPIEQSGLCAGHRQRQKFGQPINTPLRDYGDSWGTVYNAWERLLLHTNGFDKEAFERAKANVRVAMKRWMAERYDLVPKKKSPAPNNLPRPEDS